MEELKELLPDLVLLVGRDGVLLEQLGGRGIAALRPPASACGLALQDFWPQELAAQVLQLVRKSIASRCSVDIQLEVAGGSCQIRVTPQGPKRAVCVLHAQHARAARIESAALTETRSLRRDRRGFRQRFEQAIWSAAAREQPAALAVIYLDGLAEIARTLDSTVAEAVRECAVERVSLETQDAQPLTYVGEIGPGLLACILEHGERGIIEERLARLCERLRSPIQVRDGAFVLTPFVGAAILGPDSSSPAALLEQARSAALLARRAGEERICFFSDMGKLRASSPFDIGRELRTALGCGDIGLRFAGRHDLASGALVARVAYLRWLHPLRGEVPPVEFLAVAETTGLARQLSLAALQRLGVHHAQRAHAPGQAARYSLGPLRHHLLDADFAADLKRFLEESGLPAELLEVRIAERTFLSLDVHRLRPLYELGVRFIVDEVGRTMSAFERLAGAPLEGLQLDRSWTASLRRHRQASKVCRAAIGVARAMGLTPIATGVDDPEQREALRALGCVQGLGDLYGAQGQMQASAPVAHRRRSAG